MLFIIPTYRIAYSNATVLVILWMLQFSTGALAQNYVGAEDSSRIDPNTTVYDNQAAGEFTPGKGFQIVKNRFASLNISMYAMARYINQLPGEDTWHDHLNNARQFTGRNDIYWHRVMLWFTGYLGSSRKLTYMATVWTVFTTQQTLVYGNISYKFNHKIKSAYHRNIFNE